MAGPDFSTFVADYYRSFTETLLSFDKGAMADVLAVFDQVTDAGGTVWVAGNGGSAAIANHTVCDCSKGTYTEDSPPLRAISLASNMPLLTAIGNDLSFDAVFSEPLKYYLTDKDALLVVSSSGNSPNVVNACEYANARGVPTIAFVGFNGGRLKELAQHVIHVDIQNYGIVEDAHQSLIHCITQFMMARKKS